MKLKPEYRKLLEIYPSLEDEIKEKPADFWGFVEPLNKITSCYDKVWISSSMLYSGHTYKTSDPLVQRLCEDSDFNEAFHKACDEQWDDGLGYITIGYCIGSYNKDANARDYIRVYKEDVRRELI